MGKKELRTLKSTYNEAQDEAGEVEQLVMKESLSMSVSVVDKDTDKGLSSREGRIK
jgi:hypothetical protein